MPEITYTSGVASAIRVLTGPFPELLRSPNRPVVLGTPFWELLTPLFHLMVRQCRANLKVERINWTHRELKLADGRVFRVVHLSPENANALRGSRPWFMFFDNFKSIDKEYFNYALKPILASDNVYYDLAP